MTIAKVIQEGERLEKELAAENARKKPDWHLVSDLTARVFHIYKHHGPALLAVAKAAVECANDGCGCVREEPDPDGIGRRILWCDGRWPDKRQNWCWSCRMRAAVRGDAATGEGR